MLLQSSNLSLNFDKHFSSPRLTQTLYSEVASSQERLDQISPNMAAIEEYEKKNRAYVLRWQEFQECTERRDFVREKLEELKKRRLDEFLEGRSTA